MKKVFITLLCFVFYITLVSANINCDTSQVNFNLQSTNTVSSQTVSCTSTSTTSIGTTGSHLQLSITSIPVNTSTSFQITTKPNIPAGNYIEFLTSSSDAGNPFLGISIVVQNNTIIEPTTGCRLIVLPHTTNFRIKQGETAGSNLIKVKSSSECDILSMGVTEATQMSKPMFLQGQSGDINPGEEFSFLIGLDATSVSTGTFSNTYTVVGSSGDNVYTKEIFLSTTVTVGNSPIGENTFTILPTCSLDENLYLNQTHSLICNNENPNIDIEIPYNPFIKGVGVEESEGKFKYNFEPVSIGNTQILAIFKFKGYSIGNPFIKSVRITKGNIGTSGTDLKIVFYQQEAKKELNNLISGETIIQILDNQLDTLINNAELILNGIKVNKTINLVQGKEYELRAVVDGYLNKIVYFNVSESQINYIITPSTDLTTDTNINITVINPLNASILIDGGKYEGSFIGKLTAGIHEIEIIHKDFINVKTNITVSNGIALLGYSSELFNKGKLQTFTLNKNASWSVRYQEDDISQQEIKLSGVSSVVEFTPDKKGIWVVVADDKEVLRHKIESKGIWAWILSNKLISGITVIVFFIVIYFYLNKNNSSVNEITPLS